MRVVHVRNVAEAWAELPEVLKYEAEEQDSRAGRVLVMPMPVATVYSHPRERVLLDATRDCNPFFHLVEALWMLAGRDDAATLNHYIRDFGERFGEPDGRIHGAYGHRWRNAMGVDQLSVIVEKLRANPLDRQAVLQMWQAEDDTCADLEGLWHDRPCNTHAYFRVRAQARSLPPEPVLDMTVCCRSNDMVFGGYGANAVHFSVLQEYLAARIGVSVGTYTQISNNFHVYKDVWERVQWRDKVLWSSDEMEDIVPIFDNPGSADMDLEAFFRWHDGVFHPNEPMLELPSYHNSWFDGVAQPLVQAWYLHKRKNRLGAMHEAARIEDYGWRTACTEWLERRSHRL